MVTGAMAAGDQASALATLTSPAMTGANAEAGGALRAIVAMNAAAAQASAERSSASAETGILAAGIMMALALAAAIGAIVFSLLGIARPIARMTAAMGRLAGNDLAVAIRGLAGATRSAAMAAAVQVFKDGLIRARALEEETVLAAAPRPRSSAAPACARWRRPSSGRSAASSARSRPRPPSCRPPPRP